MFNFKSLFNYDRPSKYASQHSLSVCHFCKGQLNVVNLPYSRSIVVCPSCGIGSIGILLDPYHDGSMYVISQLKTTYLSENDIYLLKKNTDDISKLLCDRIKIAFDELQKISDDLDKIRNRDNI